jgi:RNA polymerase sigma-70 factor (ECF subfamily)
VGTCSVHAPTRARGVARCRYAWDFTHDAQACQMKRNATGEDNLERYWRQQLRRIARRAETRKGMRAPFVATDMDNPPPVTVSGNFEARYLAFLETIAHLRPKLHRYCARMTGSVIDAEDVVQEALFDAYRKLDTFDDKRPLTPWLFRIAHHRCIDFLRRRGIRDAAESAAAEPDFVSPREAVGPALGKAVEHLVLALPPKERACVLLKDVFDYSLEEIATLVDSTVGGAKAALNCGRAKLAEQPIAVPSTPAKSEGDANLLRLYVERFNQRDWDGLRDLIAADARLSVADRFTGRFVDSPYVGNYQRVKTPWRMAAGSVDGEPAVIILHGSADGWTPGAVVRLDVAGGRVTRIADYWHCPWILSTTSALAIDDRR